MSKMDCPSEEQLIRSALEPVGETRLEFDIPGRTVTVWHRGDAEALLSALERLDLGSTLEATTEATEAELTAETFDQAGVLRVLLAVNATMFFVEVALGWIGDSTGLLSDGLDMLADALVYGVALWAVGRSAAARTTAARLSGGLQLILALGIFFEVARRGLYGSTPEPAVMLGTAALALVANVYCLVRLSGHRSGGVHMQASYIFSANDVIANLGVIASAGLVYATASRIPDLVIGTLIGLVVLRGAVRILRLASPKMDG